MQMTDVMAKDIQGLVTKLAKKFERDGVGLEDLISEGNKGAVEAAAKYDPKAGTKFSTFAWYHIKARIIEHARENARAGKAFGTRKGRKAFLGRGEKVATDIRLDAKAGEDRAETIGEATPDEAPSAHDMLERAEIKVRLRAYRERLKNDRERALWDNYLSETPRTMAEIAADFGLTKQRMGQISQAMLLRAQHDLADLR